MPKISCHDLHRRFSFRGTFYIQPYFAFLLTSNNIIRIYYYVYSFSSWILFGETAQPFSLLPCFLALNVMHTNSLFPLWLADLASNPMLLCPK